MEGWRWTPTRIAEPSQSEAGCPPGTADPKFRERKLGNRTGRTWLTSRGPSAYNLSLATIAGVFPMGAGWSDQEVVNLHRSAGAGSTATT